MLESQPMGIPPWVGKTPGQVGKEISKGPFLEHRGPNSGQSRVPSQPGPLVGTLGGNPGPLGFPIGAPNQPNWKGRKEFPWEPLANAHRKPGES